MIINFGEYLPDLNKLGNRGSTVAKNCVPVEGGYKPFKGPSVYSSALDARVQGVLACNDKDGNTYNFAGNASKIYSLSSGTYSDVSKGGGYSTGSAERWEGVKFGEVAIMTNYNDAPQAITLGGANFADLGGSPPKARHVAVVRDQVVLANLNDTTYGVVPQGLRTSAIGDATDWTAAISTGSIYQTIEDYGAITRVIGGEFGTLIMEKAIARMTFTGGDATYQFDVIEPGKGCNAPGSVIRYGADIYYLGLDDFYLHRGGVSYPLAANKFASTFFADYDSNYKDRVSAAVSREYPIIMWGYPGSGNSGGIPNRIAIYNWHTKQWGYVELDHQLLTVHLAESLTLEQIGAIYSTLELTPGSFDDDTWKGGNYNVAIFNTDSKLADLTGTALTATWRGTETQMNQARKTMLRELRPLIDGGTHTVKVYYRDNQADTQTATANLTQANSGRYTTRTTARYHQPELTASGSWTFAQGVEMNGIARGPI